MNLDLSEDQQLLQSSVREFAEGSVRPRAAVIDQTGEFPKDLFRAAGELGPRRADRARTPSRRSLE